MPRDRDAGPRRRLSRTLGRAPWWVHLPVGLAALAIGVLLTTRPLSSLSVLGLYLGLVFLAVGAAQVLDRRSTDRPRALLVRGAVGMLLGLLTLVWLRHEFDLLALVVAAGLVASGAARCWGAGGLTGPDRATAPIRGLTEIVVGLVALQWPDLTLLLVAVLFGVRLAWFGIEHLAATWRGARGKTSDGADRRGDADPSPFPGARWVRLTGAVLALALAVGAAGLGYRAEQAAPVVDAFYSAPSEVPEEPGVLLRSEPFTRGMPSGSRAWRILYSTSAHDGAPAVASGLVVVDADAPATPRPVIAWAHGTTGYATPCAPTLLLDPLGAGALPGVDRILAQDWVLVATDYVGLGTDGPHPYLIGPGEAHSVLDAVRAAHQLDLGGPGAGPETVVWGHSQGGHAALWAGQLAASYAPELQLDGIAALAPAADVVPLTENMPNVTGGSLFASYVVAAYAATYPELDVDDLVVPAARTMLREMAGRCLSEPSALASLVTALSLARDRDVFAMSPTSGAIGDRLRENTPTGPFAAPVLVGQGLTDPLVVADVQEAFVGRLCAAGHRVDYRTYPDRDHLQVVADDSPLVDDLLHWTRARFDDMPASGCD